jgi:hypothetical protein
MKSVVCFTFLFLTSCGTVNLNNKNDIEFLVYNLKNGHAGADFLERDQFLNVLKKLEKINTKISTDRLCEQIASTLDELADGHISVWTKDGYCLKKKKMIGNVGRNDGEAHSPNAIYSYRKIKNKKTIAILSIRKFPFAKDPKWNGIKTAIKTVMKSDIIIVDLRGNSGGSSDIAKRIARWLINDSIIHNKKRIYRRNTLESWNAYRNNINDIKERVSKEGRDTSYFVEDFQYIDLAIEKLKESNSPQYLIYDFKAPEVSKVNFKGKIYILVDRLCGSSCEHMIELLRFHPTTKLVGENSAGLIHFGQMGVITLPKSAIKVSFSTQFFEGFQEGFYEKMGYPPDFATPKGEDALDFLLRNLKR